MFELYYVQLIGLYAVVIMQMWFCTKAININCRQTGYIVIKETPQFRHFYNSNSQF